jgi:atypical dual specificity phosphatase
VVAPRNFAPASTRDTIVHGADRPGYAPADVDAWIDDMLARGIRRVVCLLEPARLERYEDLIGHYRRRFGHALHAPIDDHGLPSTPVLEQTLDTLAAAEHAGEPIVLHCAAGMGRTGLMASAWLCWRHRLEVDAAIAEVCAAARRVGANRDPLEAGPLAREVLAHARARPAQA